MNRQKIALACALGCVLCSAIGLVARRARAQGDSEGADVHVCADKNGIVRVVAPAVACPTAQRSLVIQNVLSALQSDKPTNKTPAGSALDPTVLADINRRLSELERLGCAALGKRRVRAPFEVVDRAGKKMFSVIPNAAGLFNGGPSPVASLVADRSGGLFIARNGDAQVSFGINAPHLAGLTVSEGGKPRIELGKNLDQGGNYRLLFLSGPDRVIAGIGESPETRAGIVLINDGQGRPRTVMEVGGGGKGRIGIRSGNPRPIAALSEGERGAGVFYICAGGGNCDPLMVSAGTNANGVGVVATGPHFYTGGPTGAPGSFLVGKK